MIQVALKTSVGLTPLHNAASNSHVRVMEALLCAGAAVNARAGSNATALFIAAQNGHLEVRRSKSTCGAVHSAGYERPVPRRLSAANPKATPYQRRCFPLTCDAWATPCLVTCPAKT